MPNIHPQTFYSDETHEIVGKIPPWIIRKGNAVLLFTFVLLLVLSCFVTYQDKITARATVRYAEGQFNAIARIPGKGFGKVKMGQNVIVKLDCYPEAEFGYLKGEITGLEGIPQDGMYPVSIAIEGTTSSLNIPIRPIAEMEATIEVVINEYPLIMKLIAPIRRGVSNGSL